MTPERFQRIKHAYWAVRARPEAERASALTDVCGDDEALRQEVESLLAEGEASAFFATPALARAAPELAERSTSLIGRRLGPYTIKCVLGVGGMGEVYRASDSQLGRDVALKILPAVWLADPERRARFDREARLLAALNHPHIGAIYGLVDSDDTGSMPALVLELVDGGTLADRLAKGPLPIGEALTLATQIAEALEAAHACGIVHRDLKPANIIVKGAWGPIPPRGKAAASSGDSPPRVASHLVVKVVDFGLAKAVTGEESASDRPGAPTVTMGGTREGMVLGTAAYMSPEQARGHAIDKRADIWAFGCVLFEMLTGTRTFGGDNVADSLAFVLTKDPDWTALPPATPDAVRRLLGRCLEKDPTERLRDIGDAILELKDAWKAAPATPPPARVPAAPRRRERLAWGAVALALTALVAYLLVVSRSTSADVIRFGVLPPDHARFGPSREHGEAPRESSVEVSPDGGRIAFVGHTSDGRQYLWVRALKALGAQPLPGTENAVSPFWSPDSRFLGFFADGKLKKIEASGGPPQIVCDSTVGLGGTWNREGTIIFAAGASPILYQVPDSGGTPRPITTLDRTRQEIGHLWPSFLPDGRHFFYFSNTPQRADRSVFVGSLDSSPAKRVLSVNSRALYAPPGTMLFAIGNTLMAQAFDLKGLVLTGNPVQVAERVRITDQTGFSIFSVSANGVLAYQVGNVGQSTQLVWFDRTGTRLGALTEPGEFSNPSISPDGTRVAVGVQDPQTITRDIWVLDVSRKTASRLTFDASDDLNPAWSPDGTRIAFTSDRKGHRDIYEMAATGIGAEQLVLESTEHKSVDEWSSDGRYLVYNSGVIGGVTAIALWAAPLFGDRTPFPLIRASFTAHSPRLSPDGKWMAYVSTESGRDEVYVQTFPELREKWQVSPNGGNEPYWRGDGKELFYVAENKILAARVSTDSAKFSVAVPTTLFAAPFRASVLRNRYVVTPDGQRFLINVAAENPASSLITVVLNWTAELKK